MSIIRIKTGNEWSIYSNGAKIADGIPDSTIDANFYVAEIREKDLPNRPLLVQKWNDDPENK